MQSSKSVQCTVVKLNDLISLFNCFKEYQCCLKELHNENINSHISVRVQLHNKYLDVSAKLQQIVDYQESEIATKPPLLSNNIVCQMKLLTVPVSDSIPI